MKKIGSQTKESVVLMINGINKLKALIENNYVTLDYSDLIGINKGIPTLLDDIENISLGYVNINDFVDLTESYGSVLPSNKLFGLASCGMSLTNVMKYYIEFKRIQDIDKLRESLYEHTLRNGDMRVSYETEHEFEYKGELHTYTLETLYTKTLGDVFKVERKVCNLINTITHKHYSSVTEISKVTANQRIRKSVSGSTGKELVNDIAIAISYCKNNEVVVRNGLKTTIVKDQYLDSHPSGRIILTLEKLGRKK